MCLLPRHRDANGRLRVNQMVGAFRGLGDRELYALDPAVERVAVRPVVGRDRSAGVLADIAAVVGREDVRQRRVDVAFSDLLAVGVERDLAALAQAAAGVGELHPDLMSPAGIGVVASIMKCLKPPQL